MIMTYTDVLNILETLFKQSNSNMAATKAVAVCRKFLHGLVIQSHTMHAKDKSGRDLGKDVGSLRRRLATPVALEELF